MGQTSFEETFEYNVEDEVLILAAKNGDIQALKRSLDNGANPNFTHRKEDGSPFPLHESARIDNELHGIACTEVLLDSGAEISNRILTTKNTPLHEAASFGKEKICRLLIERSNSLMEYNNAYGNTALHTAIRAGHVDIVSLLLEKGCDVNARNHIGSTPLHLCAYMTNPVDDVETKPKELLNTVVGLKVDKPSVMVQSYMQIAAIILSNDTFTMINEKDNNGYTALHIAAQRGCDDMVKLLINAGADLSVKTDIDIKGRGGRTAKDTAKFSGQVKTYNLLNEMELEIKRVNKTQDR